jgi:putative DNA primase/helicase
MTKPIRKKPTNFAEMEAELEEAERLGITNLNDLYNPKIIALNSKEFLSKKLPPREFIIEPCLPKQGLMMIYAKRGVGKTYFALFLAHKIATGGDLFGGRWKIPKQAKVLYIDGEMPANAMQERLKSLDCDFANNSNSENLSIINRDLQINGYMPNLALEEGQEALEPFVKDADVIVVDNLSTLVRAGKENEATSWNPIADWALGLRSQGKSVIFIHHAGKDNNQRGTSKKEDILDTVINLKHPSDYNSEEGARFEIHFEKSRGFAGEEAKPFQVQLKLENNQASWQVSKIEDLQVERVLELSRDGLTQRDIAGETGISLSTVNRIIKKSK